MDQKIETITIENISETDEIGQERLSIHQRNTIFLPHLIWTKNHKTYMAHNNNMGLIL